MITVSFSGMGMYENCPSSYQRKYILKEEVNRPEVEEFNPKRARGTRTHNEIEANLRGHDGTLSADILKYEALLSLMRHHECQPELRWALTKEWKPCGFNDPEAMVRGIFDALITYDEENIVEVVEWKTGRKYPDHPKQRDLYGLAALKITPEASGVVVTTVYLDQYKHETTRISRSMEKSIEWVWQRNINRCQPPQPYHKRPNWKCRFCDYAKDNGGKCAAGA